MSEKTTTERLIEQYNSMNRRPTVDDDAMRKVIFKSFRRTLDPWLPVSKSVKILDIACGEGALLSFLKQEGYVNLSGFDLSSENVQICQRLGLLFVTKFDALDLNDWPDSDYDLIFALDILEHIPKEEAAQFLINIRAKLNLEGRVIVQTPNMGSVLGLFHRYSDLSHEFCLSEKSARTLFMLAGFSESKIDICPTWNATTYMGYLREIYLRLLHLLVFLAEGESRPRIPTKNLLIRAHKYDS
jgi:2-polyprenyl-3-methyl-5-hydroxy-6-metoxy-1,4-benzoquinol methylase